MARIRSIKPEFTESESVARLSRESRLLFILLWTFVDDAGRARASSRLLASRLYPYDDDAADMIDGWLTELVQEGHIRIYEVDGAHYLDIPKWLEHQKIDHPGKSRIPEFRECFVNPRETLANPPETLAPDLGPRIIGSRTKDLGSGDANASVEREAFDAYNEACEGMPWPAAQRFNETRRSNLRRRLAECGGIDGWRTALAKARASPFVAKAGWFSLDWILKPANFTKVMEGNYDAERNQANPERSLTAALAGLAG